MPHLSNAVHCLVQIRPVRQSLACNRRQSGTAPAMAGQKATPQGLPHCSSMGSALFLGCCSSTLCVPGSPACRKSCYIHCADICTVCRFCNKLVNMFDSFCTLCNSRRKLVLSCEDKHKILCSLFSVVRRQTEDSQTEDSSLHVRRELHNLMPGEVKVL